MKSEMYRLAFMTTIVIVWSGEAHARGFGGYRGGYAGYGGYHANYGGYHYGGYEGYGGYGSFAGARGYSSAGGASYSAYRGGGAAWGGGYGAAGGSYDRSWSGAYGGSVNVSGTRGAVGGPWGGGAVYGTRDVSAEGPGGRTYSSDTTRGAAVGPWGNAVAGGSRYGSASGYYGTAAGGARWGAATTRFPGDFGLSGYSAMARTGYTHSTAYWSHSAMVDRANFVRFGFPYYNAFSGVWFNNHAAAWVPGAWAYGIMPATAAWAYAAWPTVSTWADIPTEPVYFDYGNTIVYTNDNVFVNGVDAGTAPQYADQAIVLANEGQAAQPAPQTEWQPLGVFALVQGSESNSNEIFQLAIDKTGIIRGNFYDAVMDTNAPVYGKVDKKTQRAAWSAGSNKNVVFETGIYNLTKSQTPVLVHFGKDRTQQWLLVRLQKPQTGG
jgi:hypothetical protein